MHVRGASDLTARRLACCFAYAAATLLEAAMADVNTQILIDIHEDESPARGDEGLIS